MENSTIILLESCEFKNCMHAAAVSSDQITIRNCTVLTHPQMNGSAFKLRGQSTVEDTRIRIRVNPANKQAAIAHDSALFEEKIDPHPTPAVDAAILECVRVRMETDGDGVPFVRSFTMPRSMPRGIHLDPSEIFVNDGAKSDTGNIQELVRWDNTYEIKFMINDQNNGVSYMVTSERAPDVFERLLEDNGVWFTVAVQNGAASVWAKNTDDEWEQVKTWEGDTVWEGVPGNSPVVKVEFRKRYDGSSQNYAVLKDAVFQLGTSTPELG